MGFRTRISGRAGTVFGGLLLINILMQLLYIIVYDVMSRRDCGTTMILGDGADYVTIHPFAVIMILTLPLEIISTLTYLATRWVSLAFVAYGFAWWLPSLILIAMGPSGPWLYHIVLPLVMLVQIYFWKLEDGPRVSNPLPGRVPEPFR